MDKQIRWKQKFQNFQKAFIQLSAAIQMGELSDLERAGLIQTFEYSFQLAWKTMKDFLESEGVTTQTPRETLKESFRAEIISDGHGWIDALEKRNIFSLCYS